ncbi:unnamed protein product [Parajaminaea phylloscopi]
MQGAQMSIVLDLSSDRGMCWWLRVMRTLPPWRRRWSDASVAWPIAQPNDATGFGVGRRLQSRDEQRSSSTVVRRVRGKQRAGSAAGKEARQDLGDSEQGKVPSSCHTLQRERRQTSPWTPNSALGGSRMAAAVSSPSSSSSSSPLPHWPPKLTEAQAAALAAQATDFALAHGIVYRPTGQPPPSTHAHHAPISLLPSPFPRSAFTGALELQPILNELYAAVALDDAFLERVVGGNVAQVDEFQRGLWEVYKSVREQGKRPKWHLGLFRSDYLMHADPSSSAVGIRQVEFNTISSSFGPLCAKVGQLHRSLLQQTDYYGIDPSTLRSDRMPNNQALSLLADGLAEAHRTYVKERGLAQTGRDAPRVLFIVQERERNAFDQRWLEYELLHRHGIPSMRKTFTSLIEASTVAQDGTLHVSSPELPHPVTVSTVYYRAGYAPTDYTSPAHWDLRLRLEMCGAIKCPTVALQLAGAKKVQQVLSEPGVVEGFLPGRSSQEIASLRKTWAAMYPLDDDSELGRQGHKLALSEPDRFVMKPQREGGGNNIYRGDIPLALKAMEERDAARSAGEPKEREGYILMELIVPPSGIGNYLIRPPAASASSADALAHGEGLTAPECRLSSDVVSELGIYGVALFSGADAGGEAHFYSRPVKSPEAQVDGAAYLLRTKGRESDEGGVAVGFSVLDSVILV